MSLIKSTILAAVAAAALAAPAMAQNFQGFGASSEVTQQQDNAAAHSKPVKLKTNR